MKETLNAQNPPPSVFGNVRIEKRMLKFIIRREGLDMDNPVLDLSKPTAIRAILRQFLKTQEELANDNVATLMRRDKLVFLPPARYQKEMRIFMDANGTHQFNRLLHRLFEELLFEHVSNFVMFTNRAALHGVESFLDCHNLTIDDFPDVDFEHDSLVKANYRLRTVRNLIQRDTFLPSIPELL